MESFNIDQEAMLPPQEEVRFSVPIVDMKAIVDEGTKASELQKFHAACKEWGIFQVVNHGVDSALLENLRREMEVFYTMPTEEKSKFSVRPGEFEGYGHRLVQNSGDQKADLAERFYMITSPLHRRKQHLFPELPSSLRETLEAFISQLQKLAKALLGLIAEALQIDPTEIEEMFEDGMQSLRMNSYPACPEPEKVIGLTAHSDGSGITILRQVNGVEGLQIKKDGVWMPVNFLPEALAVNVGDCIEVLSNGLYKSVEHRAMVNAERERVSIAVFFNPKMEANVGPSPAVLVGQKATFKTITMAEFAKEFFSRRLQGKFLDTMRC